MIGLRGVHAIATASVSRGGRRSVSVSVVVGTELPPAQTFSRFPPRTTALFSSSQQCRTMTMATTTISGKGVQDVQGVISDVNFRDGKPTLKYAASIPLTYSAKNHGELLILAELGVPEACRECLVRNIMAVDHVEHEEAMQVFHKINESAKAPLFAYSLPFRAGFGLSFGAGIVSAPFVFDRGLVEWFNEKFVTSELPPEADLETWLEVGSASWAWMEPVLGQLSFSLLCMAFARSQLQNLGMRPYYSWQRERRAAALIEAYPKYDPEFLSTYAKCVRLASPTRLSD